MKRYIIALLSIVLLQGTVASAQVWKWRNPLPQGEALFDVELIRDASGAGTGEAFAIGYGGRILYSSNINTAQASWDVLYSTTEANTTRKTASCLAIADVNTAYVMTLSGDEYTNECEEGQRVMLFRIRRNVGTPCTPLAFLPANTGTSNWCIERVQYSVDYPHTPAGIRTYLQANDFTWGSHQFYGLYFNGNFGIAVGRQYDGPSNTADPATGTIFRTTDGGNLWTRITNVTQTDGVTSLGLFPHNGPANNLTFHSVKFIGNTGIIVGDNSTILVSTATSANDRGLSWRQMTVGTGKYNFTDLALFAKDANGTLGAVAIHGDGEGPEIFYSGDITGTTCSTAPCWQPATLSPDHYTDNQGRGMKLDVLYGVCSNTQNNNNPIPNRLYACGRRGRIIYSTDFGVNWIAGNGFSKGGTEEHLIAIDSYSAANGNDDVIVAVGQYGSSVANKGTGRPGASSTTYHQLRSGPTDFMNKVYYMPGSNTNAYAVGEKGAIMHSTDGGEDWSQIASLNGSTLYDIIFANANYGIVVGSKDAGNKGVIYRTTDAGLRWYEVPLPGNVPTLFGAYLEEVNNVISGYAVGAKGTILEYSAGAWSSIATVETNITGVNTWDNSTPNYSREQCTLYGIDFRKNTSGVPLTGTSATGLIVGNTYDGRGVIIFKANATSNWRLFPWTDQITVANGLTAGCGTSFRGVANRPGNSQFIIAGSRLENCTTSVNPQGKIWQLTYPSNVPALTDITNITNHAGVICNMQVNNIRDFYSCYYGVACGNNNSALVVGANGAILYTPSLNATTVLWDIRGTARCPLRSVAIPLTTSGNDVALAAGHGGAILQSTNYGTSYRAGELVEAQKDIPSETSLYQNYPNPFEQSTEINFAVSEPSSVRLKVFDAIGQEIMTLVDDYFPAGKYSETFNTGALPSGVYFYQLETNTYKATRSMIIIK